MIEFGGMGGVSPRASACSLRHLASAQTNDLGTSLMGENPPIDPAS